MVRQSPESVLMETIPRSHRGWKKIFKTFGGMHRHLSEKHGSPGYLPPELLCPKELCEKGLPGQGFHRKYRLVNHLMSANNNRFPLQGHGMTKGEAQRLAAELSYVRAQGSGSKGGSQNT